LVRGGVLEGAKVTVGTTISGVSPLRRDFAVGPAWPATQAGNASKAISAREIFGVTD
jgi:hypothetical protein